MGGKSIGLPLNLNQTPVSCSIVIRAYNEERQIGRLLTGISQQTIQDKEVILVDSGSTDATVAMVSAADWHYPVRVVHISPEQFTFGHALNQGIAAAQMEFVVIASAHVYPVYPDWLERLLAPFADPKVALVYGKQRGNSATRFSEHQIFSRWFPEESQLRQPYPFSNNANAAIRRRLWELRPYGENLSGLEDLEWARWVMELGNAIAYVAEAEIIHVHEDTPRGVYNRYQREAMAFKRLFPHERFYLWDFLRLFTSNIVNDVWHAVRQRKLAASASSIFWFRLMQFWGTYLGFRQSGPLTWRLRQRFYYPRGIRSNPKAQPRGIKPIRYNDEV